MGRGPVRHRVFVEDARSDGTYLRATWHGEARQFVVSTWRDDVCTGAVRVPATEAPTLIALLADGLAEGLADAAAAASAEETSVAPPPGPLRRLVAWLRHRASRRRRARAVAAPASVPSTMAAASATAPPAWASRPTGS